VGDGARQEGEVESNVRRRVTTRLVLGLSGRHDVLRRCLVVIHLSERSCFLFTIYDG
jgi:hypothetical protein